MKRNSIKDHKWDNPALTSMRETAYGMGMKVHIHRVATREEARNDEELQKQAEAKRERKKAQARARAVPAKSGEGKSGKGESRYAIHGNPADLVIIDDISSMSAGYFDEKKESANG